MAYARETVDIAFAARMRMVSPSKLPVVTLAVLSVWPSGFKCSIRSHRVWARTRSAHRHKLLNPRGVS